MEEFGCSHRTLRPLMGLDTRAQCWAGGTCMVDRAECWGLVVLVLVLVLVLVFVLVICLVRLVLSEGVGDWVR
jgi:hypothetical protein